MSSGGPSEDVRPVPGIQVRPDTIELNKLVNKPLVFDGTNPSPREWLEGYLRSKEDNQWTNTIAVKYFRTFLKGDALDWYDWFVRPLMSQVLPLETIVELFKENYLGPAEKARLQRIWDDAEQKPDDRACNFIPKMAKLLREMYPRQDEEEMVTHITKKLRPMYLRSISERNPTTIAELRDLCRRVEQGIDSIKAFESRNKAKQASSPKAKGHDKHDKKKNDSDSTKKKNFSAKTKCTRCDRNNHTVENCRARTKLDGSTLEDSKSIPKVKQITEEVEATVDPVHTIRHVCSMVAEQPIDSLINQELVCNGITVRATVDTGASASIINEQLASKLGCRIRPTTRRLAAVNGNELQVIGSSKFVVEMKVGNKTKWKEHTVLVVRGLDTPMIVGLDYLQPVGAVIDLSNRKVSFKPDKCGKGVYVPRETEVPAKSFAIIEGKTHSKGEMMVLPWKVDGLHIANSISKVTQNQKVNLLVLNSSSTPKKIASNVQVASVELINKPEVAIPDQVKGILEIGTTTATVRVGDALNSEQIQDLSELLSKYKEAFSIAGEIGTTNILEHKIELVEGAKPFAEPLRRRPQAHIEETRRQVKQMLDDGIIEPTDSPWASAYVLVSKKTGDWRLCVDFRKLNDLTKKSVYPLPNIEDCLDSIAGKKIFSQMDFAAGFWQIPMEASSKELTAFRTEDGLFQFNRMPFGLTNAPASFQKMMNILLAGLRGLDLQVFIDDICIATDTWKEHVILLEKVFKLAIAANLKLKGSKCLFGTDRVVFLGHEISQEGIRQEPKKLKAIMEMPRPTDVSGIRRVIGMFSYYRKFVPNFAMIADPLIQLTKKNAVFTWTSEHETAFRTLISELAKNATLAHFNHHDPIMLKTDASRKGIAGLLLQKQMGEWKIVQCCSRRLSASELNYGITDLEGLAVIHSLHKFRPYLLGKHFQIIVDHCALCALNKKMPTSPRLKRWVVLLSEYDYEIIYSKGGLHKDIDCLSRAPVDEAPDFYLEDKIYGINIIVDNSSWTYDDPESTAILLKAIDKLDDYSVINNTVYYKDKIYVPLHKRRELLDQFHSSILAGHSSIANTITKLSDYYWPSLENDTSDYIKSCPVCQRQKVERKKEPGNMYHFTDTEPFDRVAIDTFGPIPMTIRGNCHIVVAIDMFSRFVETKPVPDLKAYNAVDFIRELFGRFGPPKILLSDNGPQYNNDLVKETLQVFNVKHQFSTADHSRGNALVERAIQTLQEKLRMAMDSNTSENNWDVILPMVVYSMNTTIHTSTGYTPFELIFGRTQTIDKYIDRQNVTVHDLYSQLLKAKLSKARAEAIDNVAIHQSQSRPGFEQSHRPLEFNLDDQVLVKEAGKRKSKLQAKYRGPYKILHKDRDIYELEEISTNKKVSRHVSALKRYLDRCNLLLLILLLITEVKASVFDASSPPFVWTPVKDRVVFGKFKRYNINYHAVCPCTQLHPGLPTEGLPRVLIERIEPPSIKDEKGRYLGFNNFDPKVEVSKICIDLWNKEIIAKLDSLTALPEARVLSLVGHLAVGITGGVIGVVVSNLYNKVVKMFTYEPSEKELEMQIKEFVNSLFTVKETTSKLLDQVTSLTKQIDYLKQEFDQVKIETSYFVWETVRIQNKILQTGNFLDDVVDFKKRSEVPTKIFAKLFNITELNNIDPQDTIFNSVERVGNFSYKFQFFVHEEDAYTAIFEIDPFEVWRNLTDSPTLTRYVGDSYLIYNKSSNCVRAIPKFKSRIVNINCTELDYLDKRLDKWEVVKTVDNIESIDSIPQVKPTKRQHFVYCFPHNITIGKKNYLCPPSVFRLPLDKSFEILDITYEAQFVEFNITDDVKNVDQFTYEQFSIIRDTSATRDWITLLKNEVTRTCLF